MQCICILHRARCIRIQVRHSKPFFHVTNNSIFRSFLFGFVGLPHKARQQSARLAFNFACIPSIFELCIRIYFHLKTKSMCECACNGFRFSPSNFFERDEIFFLKSNMIFSLRKKTNFNLNKKIFFFSFRDWCTGVSLFQSVNMFVLFVFPVLVWWNEDTKSK